MTSAQLNWVNAGRGQLAVTHRPKRTAIDQLRAQGTTAVVTLLSQREGATLVGSAVKAAGLRWVWLPLENGHPPPSGLDSSFLARLLGIRALLESGEHVLIHCSAGIHRTGMVAYALLRLCDIGPVEARQLLDTMRATTASGVGEHRLVWGDRLAMHRVEIEDIAAALPA